MKPADSGAPPGSRDSGRRQPGPRIVLIGFLIVIALSAFIVTRILQVSGPGPDPETIPERPSGEAPG